MTSSNPKVTVNIVSAQSLVGLSSQKILFVGQKTSAGAATAGALVENIDNTGIEDTLFGAKSMLAAMIRAAKLINTQVRFDAIPLADAVGTEATASIDFSGAATAAGTLTFYIGSKRNNAYEIDVAITDTGAEISTALVAAITADTQACCTAVVNGTAADLTYVHTGLEGDLVTIKIEGSVAGITPAITGFASGATNPTLTGIFDVADGIRYQTVVWPSSYVTTTVDSFFEDRWNVGNQVLDGVYITEKIDTLANLKTAAGLLNYRSANLLGNDVVNIAASHVGGSLVELPHVVSAQYAAIRALRLEDGTDISRYVISPYGARDSFGGVAISSLPYANTPFYDLSTIDTGLGFSLEEVEELEEVGITVLGDNPANTQVILGNAVTTYKTDIAGNPDLSFKYLNYVDTISSIREYYVNNLKARFADSRLAAGDLVQGRSMANEQSIRAFMIGIFTTLSETDYVLTQAGEAARNYFINNLVVSLDLSLGKVTISMKCPIVTQLREIVATLQLSFVTTG